MYRDRRDKVVKNQREQSIDPINQLLKSRRVGEAQIERTVN
jgi:hypothetical protein